MYSFAIVVMSNIKSCNQLGWMLMAQRRLKLMSLIKNQTNKTKNLSINYSMRVFACLFALSIHINLFYGSDPLPLVVWAVLIAHSLLYPHVIFLLSSTIADEKRNLLLDSFFYSLCCAVWGYNLFLVAVFLSVVNMTNLAAGGMRLFLKGLPMQAMGLLAGGLLVGFEYRESLSTLSTLVATAGLVIYTSPLGLIIYRINSKLRENKQQLQKRTDHLESLNRLAYSVNSTLDLDLIMKGLMKTLEVMFPFESLYVISKMPDQRKFKIIGAFGSAISEYEEFTFKDLEMDIEEDADSIFIRGLTKDCIINIPRVTAEAVNNASNLDKSLYNIKPSRSLCYFPVHVQNKVVAGVAFINHEKTFQLNDDDLKLINEYLVQVGTAIKNVSMYELAEQARKSAEQSEKVKGHFLANMSHEIRTPMTAIIGYSEALLDDSLGEKNKQEFANTIIRSSKHLLTVINDILDISKIESKKIDMEIMSVELPVIISDLDDHINQLCKENGLTYQLKIEYPLPSVVQLDPTRLKQILFNLINNAVKFTHEGWVKIEISYTSEKMIFSVDDSGIGLTEDETHAVFGAFTQADSSTTRLFGGTGLGLYISQNLARLMGGELSVVSQKGVGSCFTLSVSAVADSGLPSIQSATALTESMDEYKSKQKTLFIPKLTGRVLLAEDNTDNQLLIQRLIMVTGAEVHIVDDGQQALDAVINEHFDLIFLDMQMPNMGGEESARLMRERGVHQPIIAFTANVMKHQIDHYTDNGFNHVVEKPIYQDQLYAVMQDYLPSQNNLGAVLVVEDDLVNQQIMVRLVKKANPQVTVLTANNGAEAVEICQQHSIKLIFMDMEMAVMGGLEATIKLRKMNIKAPIYMTTGHIDPQHKQQSLDAGANGFLVKPVDRERLFSLIHTSL
ncbi:MAG: signal transduction histidine kinase/DNA-binding response OmpR family regulator [Psychrobacter glaciei]